MSAIAVRRVDRLSRREMLGLLEGPGSVFLEGWSDDGRLTIVLPWPDEIRELGWDEVGKADAFLETVIEEPDFSPDLPDVPFLGGWVGFIAYEVGAAWENAAAREDAPDEPAAWFAKHSVGLVQRADGQTVVFGPQSRLYEIMQRIQRATPDTEEVEARGTAEFEDSMGAGAYQSSVDDIRERISWGEVYQVNLTRRFVVDREIDPVELYLGMTGDEPPRCSALLRGEGWSIVSASPEVFLRFDPSSGRADSRPIKGTLRRTGDFETDREGLLASRKDEAEHLMIVDLVRNDLGKLAPPGNVRVSEYKRVQTLAHVLHLESVVEGHGLAPGDLRELIRALFPAGSITGAPKRAAVRAIREIEPCARGVYTGAIGFVDRRGNAELSVAIRTAVIGKGECRYHAGGGIVWDSDPEAEDRESFAKSIGFMETMGLEIT